MCIRDRPKTLFLLEVLLIHCAEHVYEKQVNEIKFVYKPHIKINQGKTKYMPVTRKDCCVGPKNLEIESYKFEIVHSLSLIHI